MRDNLLVNHHSLFEILANPNQVLLNPVLPALKIEAGKYSAWQTFLSPMAEVINFISIFTLYCKIWTLPDDMAAPVWAASLVVSQQMLESRWWFIFFLSCQKNHPFSDTVAANNDHACMLSDTGTVSGRINPGATASAWLPIRPASPLCC